MPSLSRLQRTTLVEVLRATLKGGWYRAGNSPAHGSPAGERVTLASLYTSGLLVRRAWRGVEGEPSAAHEYQAAEALVKLSRENGLADILLKHD